MTLLADGCSPFQYEQLAGLAKSLTGQTYDVRKAFLLVVRLRPVMNILGVASVDDLLQRIGRSVPSNLESYLADALTDGETWFFRQRDTLMTVAAAVVKGMAAEDGGGPVSLWCAGGSTGQEAYSLAILIEELSRDGAAGTVRIVTSDVGHQATSRARSGTYSHFEIQKGLSASRMVAHFFRKGQRDWQASANLRERVEACQHNLLDGPVEAEAFDFVLCRNVLSDMAEPEARRVVAGLVASLKPDGRLLLEPGEAIPPDCGLRADPDLGDGFYAAMP